MRQLLTAATLALTLAALPARAVVTDIPTGGLPSATDYTTTLLPERAGVVSWRTLAQVEPVKQDGKMVPSFSRDILGLDQKNVKVQGFIIPLDLGEKQKRFLLSAVQVASHDSAVHVPVSRRAPCWANSSSFSARPTRWLWRSG